MLRGANPGQKSVLKNKSSEDYLFVEVPQFSRHSSFPFTPEIQFSFRGSLISHPIAWFQSEIASKLFVFPSSFICQRIEKVVCVFFVLCIGNTHAQFFLVAIFGLNLFLNLIPSRTVIWWNMEPAPAVAQIFSEFPLTATRPAPTRVRVRAPRGRSVPSSTSGRWSLRRIGPRVSHEPIPYIRFSEEKGRPTFRAEWNYSAQVRALFRLRDPSVFLLSVIHPQETQPTGLFWASGDLGIVFSPLHMYKHYRRNFSPKNP